jgi:hypothetical protein
MKPLGVSVGLECRGARKTDVTGPAGAPASAAEQYIGFCTLYVLLRCTIQGDPTET